MGLVLVPAAEASAGPRLRAVVELDGALRWSAGIEIPWH